MNGIFEDEFMDVQSAHLLHKARLTVLCGIALKNGE